MRIAAVKSAITFCVPVTYMDYAFIPSPSTMLGNIHMHSVEDSVFDIELLYTKFVRRTRNMFA